jgi:hypothetical protein
MIIPHCLSSGHELSYHPSQPSPLEGEITCSRIVLEELCARTSVQQQLGICQKPKHTQLEKVIYRGIPCIWQRKFHNRTLTSILI